jgi:hypothetical protein
VSRSLAAALAAALALTVAAGAAHAVPTQVSFAGRLVSEDGPVDGNVTLRFRLLAGASAVWEESHASVAASDGLLFVALGSSVPLDDRVFTGAALQLEVTVDGEVLSPTLPLASVPYAVRAGEAASLGGRTALDFAPAVHDHAGTYLPRGATTTCGGSDKVRGLDPDTGNVICAADLDTNTTYSAGAGGGLALNAGNAFSIATSGVTTARIADLNVTAAKLANDSVTRAKILGTEVAIYQRSSFCASRGGDLWPSAASCSTAQCAPGVYFNCAGSCNQPAAASCAPTLLGYLLAP